MRHIGLAAGCLILAACSDSDSDSAGSQAEVERGARLVTDPKLSPAALNFVACTTCHATGLEGPQDTLFPGAPLAGTVSRGSFWAGQEEDLLGAVNHCRNYFMYADIPWQPQDPDARAIWAYLVDLDHRAPPELRQSQKLTFVNVIEDVPRGAPEKGAEIYRRACKQCHGDVHTGAGRPSSRPRLLPDESVREHAYLMQSGGPPAVRLVFIEKIRHGGFYGYGGSMPPFSREVLIDADVGDLLEFFSLIP